MRPSTFILAFIVAGFSAGLAVRSEAADGILLVQKVTTGTSAQTSRLQIEKTRLLNRLVVHFLTNPAPSAEPRWPQLLMV